MMRVVFGKCARECALSGRGWRGTCNIPLSYANPTRVGSAKKRERSTANYRRVRVVSLRGRDVTERRCLVPGSSGRSDEKPNLQGPVGIKILAGQFFFDRNDPATAT